MSRLAFAAATLLALAFVLAGIGPKVELSAQDAIVPFGLERQTGNRLSATRCC